MRLSILTALALATAIPQATAALLSFNTFTDTDCARNLSEPNGFQENFLCTQKGRSYANFPSHSFETTWRRSFEIIEADGKCNLTVFEDEDGEGKKLEFGNIGAGTTGWCYKEVHGFEYESFDVVCV